MDGVNIVTGVAQVKAVAFAFLQMNRGGSHRAARISHSVNGPLIEAFIGSIFLLDKHGNSFIGSLGGGTLFRKPRIAPTKGRRSDPLRLASAAGVLDDDAHAVSAIIVGEIAERPDAWMAHLDDGRDALRRAQPEHRDRSGIRHGVSIERDNAERVARQGKAAN